MGATEYAGITIFVVCFAGNLCCVAVVHLVRRHRLRLEDQWHRELKEAFRGGPDDDGVIWVAEDISE